MKWSFRYIPFIALSFFSCNKSKLGDVISDLQFSTRSVVADGASKITISVVLNGNADSAKRNILFSASNGSFLNGNDSSISEKAVFVNSQLIAKVTYQPPLKAQTVYFVVQPNQSSASNVSLRDSLVIGPSLPAKIALTKSSFAVGYGFTSEDTMTAKLTNSAGNPVSLGTKVTFKNYYPGGAAFIGSYRMTDSISNASSEVSTIYSPGFVVPVGSDFYFKVTVLDSSGNPTKIADSTLITVIQLQ